MGSAAVTVDSKMNTYGLPSRPNSLRQGLGQLQHEGHPCQGCHTVICGQWEGTVRRARK